MYIKNSRYTYQQSTADGSAGGNGGQQQTQNTAQSTPAPAQGAFGNLLARLGLGGNNQQAPAPAPQQQSAASNSNQQAPQQAAPLPSEFFGKLFTPQAPAQQAEKQPAANPWDTSPEALTKNFGNIDVGQFVKPETVTAALSGDHTAFMEVLNNAAKIGAMSAYQASMNNSKQGVELSATNLQQQLPEQMKHFTLDDNLGQDPVLSAPHLQPVVKLVKNSILATYPKATAADIKEGVLVYLQDLGGKFGTQTNNNTQPKQQSSINWDEHFKTL